MPLQTENFKIVKMGDCCGGYFSTIYKGREICLEPCCNGFDIGVYDQNQNILRPKICTNLTGANLISSLDKAVDIVNDIILNEPGLFVMKEV